MEKRIKVFLDSNVLFSIAYSGKEKSRSYLIYELQELGILTVCLSGLVCEEARLNIRRKKADSEPFLDDLIARSGIVGDIIADIKQPEVSKLPQNDRIILATAIYHKQDVFVTGNDKDFKELYQKKFIGTLILKPADFLNMNF